MVSQLAQYHILTFIFSPLLHNVIFIILHLSTYITYIWPPGDFLLHPFVCLCHPEDKPNILTHKTSWKTYDTVRFLGVGCGQNMWDWKLMMGNTIGWRVWRVTRSENLQNDQKLSCPSIQLKQKTHKRKSIRGRKRWQGREQSLYFLLAPLFSQYLNWEKYAVLSEFQSKWLKWDKAKILPSCLERQEI